MSKTKFKQTEIGKIPEDWAFNEIGKHAKIIMGQSPESIYYNSDGKGTLFLQGIRTFGNLYPKYDTWTTKVPKLAKKDSILLSVRAPVGEVNIADNDICIGRGLMSIEGKNNKFIFYLFKAFKEYVINKETGTVYGSVTRDDITKLQFPFPNDIEQSAITKILSDFDEKIELNQQMNKTLEAIGQAIFKHWFIDFEFPNEEGKPYKSSGGEMVYNEELGKEIPKGWKWGTLSYLIEEKRIKIKDGKAQILSAIKTGELLNSEDFFTKQVYSKSINKYLEVKKFNFAYNPSRINIGSIGLLKENILGAVSPVYVVFSCKNHSHYFIEQILKNSSIKAQIVQFCSGTVRQNLDYKGFRRIKLIIPNENLFIKYNEFYEKLSLHQKKIKDMINTLTQIHDLLLPKLMLGKIRVPLEVK